MKPSTMWWLIWSTCWKISTVPSRCYDEFAMFSSRWNGLAPPPTKSTPCSPIASDPKRSQALPKARKLIQVALDDIYLEADQRDAGEAIGLEETARVLEELITQLDASGLTDGRPRGMMWDFQRDGLLPFERESIPAEHRIPVNEAMLNDLEPHLVHAEEVSVVEATNDAVDDEGWSPLPPPADDEAVMEEVATTPS